MGKIPEDIKSEHPRKLTTEGAQEKSMISGHYSAYKKIISLKRRKVNETY